MQIIYNDYLGKLDFIKEELREEVQYGGVGTYIGETEHAQHNLFI